MAKLLHRTADEEVRARVEANRKPAAPAAALQVTSEPVYLIPRTWLRPLEHNGAAVNPRRHFDPARLQELADSMREVGIQQPLVVRTPTAVDAYNLQDPGTWTEAFHPVLDIVAGERRWRASEIAGLDLVPCYLRPLTIEQAVDVCIVENDQRSDLTAIERARGYRAWLDLVPGRTQAQLAQRIGVTQGQISNAIRLLELPEALQVMVESGAVHATHARDFAMPFAQLREPFRTVVLDGIVAKLQVCIRNQTEIRAETIRQAAREVTIPLSRTLDTHTYSHPCRFDPALHEECTCGAPAYAYDYGDRKVVRCFDLEWWDAQQRASIAAAAEKREAAVEAMAAGNPDGAVVDEAVLETALTYGERKTLAMCGEMGTHGLFDPRKIPPRSLVWVKTRRSYGPGKPVYDLVCTDAGAARSAELAATRELNKRIKAAREEREAAILTVAKAGTWEPWMFGEALVLAAEWGSSTHLVQAMTELGIKSPEGKYGNDKWRGLSEDDQRRVLVYAVHVSSLTRGWGSIDKEIREQLRDEYSAFLPPLPGTQPKLPLDAPIPAATTAADDGEAEESPPPAPVEVRARAIGQLELA